jgi:hypothetical protein
MKTALWGLALASALLAGCSRTEAPKRPSTADIQKQIAKVQSDQNIPPQVKGMILGKLEGERQAAVQREGAAKR